MALKKAWITPWGESTDLVTLSLESAVVNPEYMRLSADQSVLPADPTKEQHHVTLLRLLDTGDLIEIRDVIVRYLQESPA